MGMVIRCRRVVEFYALVALFLIPAVETATAQFGDVATDEQARLDKQLKTAKRKCQQGDGESCFVIAELIRSGKATYEGDELTYAWTLTESACRKTVDEACDYLSSHTKPSPKLTGLKGAIATIGVLGSGLAAGMSAPAGASDLEKRNAIATAMANTAAALGDERAAQELRDQAELGKAIAGATTISGVSTGGMPGGANGSTVFSGTWAYTGRMSNEVRLLLTRSPSWQCPQTPSDAGAPPSVAASSTSQRDQYVAAAVMTAWAMECYARQGNSVKAADLEPRLAEFLSNVNALCSNAGPDLDPRSVATLSIWPCGNSTLRQATPQPRSTPVPYTPSNEDLGSGVAIPSDRDYKSAVCSGNKWFWEKTGESQMKAIRTCESRTGVACRVVKFNPSRGGASLGC